VCGVVLGFGGGGVSHSTRASQPRGPRGKGKHSPAKDSLVQSASPQNLPIKGSSTKSSRGKRQKLGRDRSQQTDIRTEREKSKRKLPQLFHLPDERSTPAQHISGERWGFCLPILSQK